MEDWNHSVKCAELCDPDLFLYNLSGILEVVTKELCVVGIRTKGEDGAAKILEQMKNLS